MVCAAVDVDIAPSRVVADSLPVGALGNVSKASDVDVPIVGGVGGDGVGGVGGVGGDSGVGGDGDVGGVNAITVTGVGGVTIGIDIGVIFANAVVAAATLVVVVNVAICVVIAIAFGDDDVDEVVVVDAVFVFASVGVVASVVVVGIVVIFAVVVGHVAIGLPMKTRHEVELVAQPEKNVDKHQTQALALQALHVLYWPHWPKNGDVVVVPRPRADVVVSAAGTTHRMILATCGPDTVATDVDSKPNKSCCATTPPDAADSDSAFHWSVARLFAAYGGLASDKPASHATQRNITQRNATQCKSITKSIKLESTLFPRLTGGRREERRAAEQHVDRAHEFGRAQLKRNAVARGL